MSEVRDPILEVENLTRYFDVSKPLLNRLLEGGGRRIVRAVDGVSFAVERGTTFSLVGESGCGKTTVARCVAGLHRPTGGSIRFMGADIAAAGARGGALEHRRHLQMIFQDPYASLNPRWRVWRIIAEPIVTHRLLTGRRRIRARVDELLTLVGLAPEDGEKFPHQFSGGQRQRVSIARALASNPGFIICDEPTSALDVSVQAQILNLMRDLQEQLGLTYLLISHNLAVVAHMSRRMGVMYLGRLVEWGDTRRIFTRPRHPYTRMLLDTLPDLDMTGERRIRAVGEVPSPIDPPPGCAFHPRCPFAEERCRREPPRPVVQDRVTVACHAIEEGRLPASKPIARTAVPATPPPSPLGSLGRHPARSRPG